MDIKSLEEQIAKFIYELETEDRLVRVGLKDVAATAKVYKKFKELFTSQKIDEISHQIKKVKDPKQKDILTRIYFTLIGSFIGQNLAPEEDKITTYFSKATVTVRGEKIAYFQLTPLISKEPLFEKRELLDDAATPVVTKINPKQLTILASEIKLLKSLGFGSYIDFYQKSKKMDYARFQKVVVKMTGDTQKIWLSVMSRVSQEELLRPFKNLRACHLVYLRSLSMFDNYYPKDRVLETFKKWTRDFGLSDLIERINIDDVERTKKNPRAVCYWPKPPTEIQLVIKPIGGEQDFEAMFHEGGHALHGAAIAAKLPYSLRALAYSNALSETYAFILEDLVFNPEFLTTYLNVSTFTGNRIKWQAYFVNLMMLRRYLGKFLNEYEMFNSNALNNGPNLYKKHLEATTGFIIKRENWLSDMDSGFYSAEYLRAWIASAQIQDYLVKKFGRRWFVNKRAGEFLRKLYARGVTDEVEDVVKRLGYKPWDTNYLVKAYRQILI